MPPQRAGQPPRRNDPCPCGSGRKYKSCCLGRAGTAAAPAAAPAPPPVDVADLLAQAVALLRTGRLGDAARAFRAVLQREPRNATALYWLGRAAGDRGEIEQGIRLLRRAVAADGCRAELHVALAETLLQAGRATEAAASAARAVESGPDDADAHAVLATCHERRNRLADAATSARAALALDADHPGAGILLGRLLRRQGDPGAARERVEALVASATVPDYFRQQGLYELGHALDALGEVDDAFAAFERAGRERADGGRGRRIDRTADLRRIDAYRAGLTPERLGRWSADGLDDGLPRPAFLVGFPRSGTTMTEQVLAAHPDVVTMDEKPVVRSVKHEIARMTGAQDPEDVPAMLARLDRGQVLAARAHYWRRIDELVGPAARSRTFVDKLPLNLIHAGLINAIFPEARLIVALRDPRDVCLSCLMQWMELSTTTVHFLSLEGTAAYYDRAMGLWLHLRGMLALPFVEVRYEDTVRDLAGQARRILDLLGAPWHDDVLRFHEQARDRFVSTPSYAAVAQPVHAKAVGRWQRYRRHLEPVLPRLERYVEAFGYEGTEGRGD